MWRNGSKHTFWRGISARTTTPTFLLPRFVDTCIHQARRDVTERESMLQRDRQSVMAKVQHESGLEKGKLDKEFAQLREDKLKLDGLNREMNDRGSQVRRPTCHEVDIWSQDQVVDSPD